MQKLTGSRPHWSMLKPLPHASSLNRIQAESPHRQIRWRLQESKKQPMKSSRKRSEEHTSELQSPCNLVCRLLLEKKKKKNTKIRSHNRRNICHLIRTEKPPRYVR